MNKEKFLSEATKVFNYTEELLKLIQHSQQIIILGNGGSNAIASHISQDYTKQMKKTAFSFSDPSRLTCYINDYGMEHAYAKFLEEFIDVDLMPLVILISSSGNSENIINCAEWCESECVPFVALSGFDSNNKLNSFESSLLKLKVHIESHDYGIVELAHEILLHSVLGGEQ